MKTAVHPSPTKIDQASPKAFGGVAVLSKAGFFVIGLAAVAAVPKLHASALSLDDFNRAETLIAEAIENRRTSLNLRDLKYLTSIPESVQQIKGLQFVSASGTKLDNVESLAGLPNLRTLQIAATRVTDLSPLDANTSLETLDIGRSWVYDLEPLKNLRRLHWLQMDRVAVKSLCPATKIQSLNWINLYSSYAEDGSYDCFKKLERRVREVGGGNSYRQNYIPGGGYKAEVSFKRILQEWEWR